MSRGIDQLNRGVKTPHLKTTEEHVASAAKYVVPSAGGAWAINSILMFMFPQLQPISEPILTLLTIAVNLLTVYFIK